MESLFLPLQDTRQGTFLIVADMRAKYKSFAGHRIQNRRERERKRRNAEGRIRKSEKESGAPLDKCGVICYNTFVRETEKIMKYAGDRCGITEKRRNMEGQQRSGTARAWRTYAAGSGRLLVLVRGGSYGRELRIGLPFARSAQLGIPPSLSAYRFAGGGRTCTGTDGAEFSGGGGAYRSAERHSAHGAPGGRAVYQDQCGASEGPVLRAYGEVRDVGAL